jgi:hypothetical protein
MDLSVLFHPAGHKQDDERKHAQGEGIARVERWAEDKASSGIRVGERPADCDLGGNQYGPADAGAEQQQCQGELNADSPCDCPPIDRSAGGRAEPGDA